MTEPSPTGRSHPDSEPQELADAVLGRTLAAREFIALGDVGQRLIHDAWNLPFLGRAERNRLLGGLPDPDSAFEASVTASRAERPWADALRDAWFETWLRGYFLGLARLHRENAEFDRTPKHTWQYRSVQEYGDNYARLGRLGGGSDPVRIQAELRWLGYGALAPWTWDVVHGALAFVCSQQDDAMLPLYPVGTARVTAMYSLWAVATDGYAVARAQQEPALMSEFLSGLRGLRSTDPVSGR